MSDPTPYPDLNTVLRELVTRIQTVLTDNFIGAYLQGSFAVGDFDEHSDVDFIVALERDLNETEVEALQTLHDQLFEFPIAWAQHLEGSYFPKDILRDYARSGGPVWYLDHGSRHIIRSAHCNTALVRWVVRAQGVPLAGPDPVTLVDPIPVRALQREILGVIRNWGRDILADPEPYRNRFYQGFIALNFCRMLNDLQRGVPGSKRAGADWAKINLDPSWHGLIDRAWDCRPDPATSVRQHPDPDDFAETLALVEHIIRKSTAFAEAQGLL